MPIFSDAATYSGTPVSGGKTTDNMLSINLYFNIRSLTVVDVKDGAINEDFRMTSYVIGK